jgi:hypothetical protein
MTGNATCKSLCDYGFTSNGTPLRECEDCDKTCLSCQDNNEVGDKFKCTECAPDYRFFYSPTSTCMASCGQGYYQVNDETCDHCHEPCHDCQGDKFNCTLCDHTSPEKALFTQKQSIKEDGVIKEITRGTCFRQCPNGYFMNVTTPDNILCNECDSPCATCEGGADRCMSCDGRGN